MPYQVKRVSDMIEKDREEGHVWKLRRVVQTKGGHNRLWFCDCGATDVRYTPFGEDLSRRVCFKIGGDGHG